MSADLKRLPLDVLKIDRSFVGGLGHSPEDTAIVHAVMALAKPLHPKVTGDGTEASARAALLGERGCDRGQGYLFGKPRDGRAVGMLLQVATDRGQGHGSDHRGPDQAAGSLRGDHHLAAATIH